MIIAFSASIVCYAALFTYAYLAEPKMNRFTFFTLELFDIKIDEELKYDDGKIKQGEGAKEVRILNPPTNTNDVVVRALVVPVVYDKATATVAESSFDSINDGPAAATWVIGDLTIYMADQWSDHWFFNGGYFYYKKIIKPGGATEPLITGAALSNSGYYDSKELTVEIFAEGIDAENMSEWGLPY